MPTGILITPSVVALVERFDAVLYPFPLDVVLKLLPQQGWVVRFEEEERAAKLTAPVSKGNVNLVFEQAGKTLGVRGNDVGETLAEFRELRAFVIEKFGLPPAVSSDYTEFRFTGSANTGRRERNTPPEVIEAWWSGHPRSEALAIVLKRWIPNEDLGAYGVRMATKGQDPNRPNWAELTIAPASSAGHRVYQFDLIYRNEDREAVEAVAERSEQLLSAAVEELER